MGRASGKGRKILIGVVAVVAVLAPFVWMALPGLARLRAYRKLVDYPGLLPALSAVPEEVTLDPPEGGDTLSLGYVELRFRKGTLKRIESSKDQRFVSITIGSTKFGFMPPFSYESYEEFLEELKGSETRFARMVREASGGRIKAQEGNPGRVDADPTLSALLRERVEEPYAWALRVARTMPRTDSQVFFMPGPEFDKYFLLAFEKADNTFTQRGLVAFEAEGVKGILHLGNKDKPGMMFASLYARDSDVQQGLYIHSGSHEEARQAVLKLLSGLRYTLPKIPDSSELTELIHQAIDSHPLYWELENELEVDEDPKPSAEDKEQPQEKPASPPGKKEKRPATPEELSQALEKVLALKHDSYHVILREASHILPPLLVGREWKVGADLMKKHKRPAVKSWANGSAVHSHHLLKKKFVTFPNGRSLDLKLILSARNLNDESPEGTPGKLYSADVMLVANVEAPYDKVMKEKWYPEDSVIDVALKRAVREGNFWPFVKHVTVHYDLLFNRWIEWNPSGFTLSIEFAASLEERIGGHRQTVRVASGLDPLRSYKLETKPDQPWTSEDTLGPPSLGGSNSWWHGTPEKVKENQRKYLRKKK